MIDSVCIVGAGRAGTALASRPRERCPTPRHDRRTAEARLAAILERLPELEPAGRAVSDPAATRDAA